jgi:hypothetical protein
VAAVTRPFAGPSFTAEHAKTWLQGLDPKLADETLVSVFVGPSIEDFPNRIVTVTEVPGPGLTTQGLVDNLCFQVRSRGEADDEDDAADLAKFIHRAVLSNPGPTEIGDRRIISARRLGGAPSPVPGTPDAGRRWEYVATYLLSVNTDL